MRDALPHLFEAAPNLLYQLVTMVSPKQLLARGVPVHRLVHEEGSFVITFPNAYHSGFNTGGRPLIQYSLSYRGILPQTGCMLKASTKSSTGSNPLNHFDTGPSVRVARGAGWSHAG